MKLPFPYRLGLILSILAAGATWSMADVLHTIKERGKLIVGVKADYRPYGFRDVSGNIVGIEPELAMDVARKLGVELDLVPVVSFNRMQFLKEGHIDLMIATMSDRKDRRKVVQIIEPPYYSSGTNILSAKEASFTDWKDLKKRPVCGIEGAFYNKKTRKAFGAKIITFKGTAEVLDALKKGVCLAFVYDDAFIISKLLEPKWAVDFEMPLESIDNNPWGIAVAHGEENFAAFMTETIKEWHRSGRILELETRYALKNTAFAKRMHEKYKARPHSSP